MPREINAAGYRLIKEFEAGPLSNNQPALKPYLCPAGRWTNGWGNTHGVTANTPSITVVQAEADLERNLDWAEACVERHATLPNDNEFAAMVSLCFNIGLDSRAGFPSSTVLRLHNRGDKAGAAAAFAMWRKMRDPNTGSLVDSAGLLRRRNLEANLYLTSVPERTTISVGEAQTPIEVSKLPPPAELMPQAVAAEKSAASSKTVIAGGLSVAAGAATVADQANQLSTSVTSVTQAVSSMQGLLELGALALSIIALMAAAYFTWRYVQKKRRGEVMST
jgi:lysozyme